jgi:hypothetical protein
MKETELRQQLKKDKVPQRTTLRYSPHNTHAQISKNNNYQQIKTYFCAPVN